MYIQFNIFILQLQYQPHSFLYILIFFCIFQAFSDVFSVILRISHFSYTKHILTTFVYDTFAQKNSETFSYLGDTYFSYSNYLITTSFHASDGTIAMYVLPTFNTNSLPFASKYCVGLVRSPFFHVISVTSPFTM